MLRLARLVLRHRRTVIFAWLVVMVLGVFAAPRTVARLEIDFSLPGQPGYETSREILATYGNGGPLGNVPTIVVATAPPGQDITQQLDQVAPVMAKIAAALPAARLVDYSAVADPALITDDKRSIYALIYDKEFTSFADKLAHRTVEPILKEASALGGLEWQVTGYPILSEGGSDETQTPNLLLDTILAGTGALIVLLFLFASLLALVPLLIAAVSILTTFAIVLGTTYVMDVSFVVQFLVALIGLGVAVDYSLLVVNRWREERARGRDNHEAVLVAMQQAGHAVLASAATVAISLCALLIIPVPLLQSMGVGGMLIPVVSAAVVLTLLPALLGGIGPRVDWPRIRHEDKPSRAWTAWGRGVVRFRWLTAVGAGAVLLALFLPILDMKIGQARTDSLASGGSAYEALVRLKDGGVPAGVVSPMEILIKGPDAATWADEVVRRVEAVPGIAEVFAPNLPSWRKGDAVLVEVLPVAEIVDSTQAGIADDVRAVIAEVPGVVGISGNAPTIQDYLGAVYGKFPLTIALIAAVTFILLVRTFRSVLLPLKAVLLNIVSVGATFGATVLFWQQGMGSAQLFGISATGAITFWVPLMIFAFLFGLSMDYEVFILARMREEYDRHADTDTAVVAGLARTGRLVTGAALILFLSFIALAGTPGTEVKVLATALGIGILLDATLVRAVLVPALVSLFGTWNWWLPGWVATVLRIKPMPAPAHPIPTQVPHNVVPADAPAPARFTF